MIINLCNTSLMTIGPSGFMVAVVVFSLMTPIGNHSLIYFDHPASPFFLSGAILGLFASAYDSGQAFTGMFTSTAGGTFMFISLNELIPKAFNRKQVCFHIRA